MSYHDIGLIVWFVMGYALGYLGALNYRPRK